MSKKKSQEQDYLYGFVAGRKKAHRIRFRFAGKRIEEYFYSKKEAIIYRDKIVKQLETLDELLPHLDAPSFTGDRLSVLDYGKVTDAVKNLETKMDAIICHLTTAEDSPIDEEEAKRSSSISLNQLVMLHLESRELESGKPVCMSTQRTFLYWATDSELAAVKVNKITKKMILVERKKLIESGLANGTVNRYIGSLSSAWTYLVDELELVEVHIPRKIKNLVEIKNHTVSYNDKEVAHIIDLCYQADVDARKNNEPTFQYLGPLIEMFSETGIRHEFMSSLHWNEIEGLDSDDPCIHKLMKGDKDVTVGLSDVCVGILQKLGEKNGREGYVFISPVDHRTYSKRWYPRFKRILEENNKEKGSIKVRITAKPVHSFRAYVATRLAEAGASANDIADQIGVTLVVAEGYRNRTSKQRQNNRNRLNESRPKSSSKVRAIR